MKVKIHIPEEVKFEHEVIANVPDNLDIGDILDDLEGCDGLDEATYKLEKAGIEILEISRDQDGAVWDITYCDYDEINEDDEEN